MSIKEMLGKIKKPVLLTGLAITSIGAPKRSKTRTMASACINEYRQKIVFK